ncbi:MAG: branched-chain amino acid aminotransferase [SAR324 cluster bacterium]|nr:branched-chain amino acid aminotransferase [SAR324 cluster bacterium]
MNIQINPVSPESRKNPPESLEGIEFGSHFTNHMFLMNWEPDGGWQNARIEQYQALSLDPAAIVLHYGHEAFEGLKAYLTVSGNHVLFRPRKNFERLQQTSRRIGLPEIDADFGLEALKLLLQQDKDWIPNEPGCSLYVRPNLIATEPALSLKKSEYFLFYIILSPVGSFYAKGFAPVRIKVSEDYTRAAAGGIGGVKTAGNYAASNLAQIEAKKEGFSQVLWLDGKEQRYVEEVGSMNIFFVIDDEIVTPQLTGSILPGITRDSVLQLSRNWGLKTTERRITIEEVIEGIENGRLTEIFGAGTAAVISPVGVLQYKGKEYVIQDDIGPMAERFYDEVTGIQYGKTNDPFQWLEPIY